MKRTFVNSSSVASVGYDAATSVLEVEFRNGNVYRYFAVPSKIHGALVEADSVGAFVNTVIKPHYPCARD
jgi:hypothetical protein